MLTYLVPPAPYDSTLIPPNYFLHYNITLQTISNITPLTQLSLKATSSIPTMPQSQGDFSALNDVRCFDVESLGSWLNYRKIDINLLLILLDDVGLCITVFILGQ